MAVSKAQKEATKKWNKEHLVAVNFRVYPEVRDNFRKIADNMGVGYAELFRTMINDFASKIEG